MQRDEMHKGLLVRLLSEYSNVPTGTWATVDSTGIMRDGVWWFTVRWHLYRPIPTRFPQGVTDYSLNLSEPDLALFEVVSSEEEQAARRSKQEFPSSSTLASIPHLDEHSRSRRLSGNASVHPTQLCLFLVDDI